MAKVTGHAKYSGKDYQLGTRGVRETLATPKED